MACYSALALVFMVFGFDRINKVCFFFVVKIRDIYNSNNCKTWNGGNNNSIYGFFS